jgi:hypothetical protein
MLPVDLLRLTWDAWKLTKEGFCHRVLANQPDQPCPFCRGQDQVVPRQMFHKIRYWNIWLLRILYPHLKSAEPVKGLRRVPVCVSEGGYIFTPWYTPVLAVGLTLLWAALIVWGLWVSDSIPDQEKARFLEWIG